MNIYNMFRIKRLTSAFLACLLMEGTVEVNAQKQLNLSDVINIARENSFSAQLARYSYMASYWTYRSFKAQLLPSMNLSGSLMNYNRSFVEARNYEDGKIAYVENNSLSNSLSLSVDQNILATGGTISLQSYLYRLDQFNYNLKTYNSQPVRISYTQPLRAYNDLKWEKKTAPIEYTIAQKKYLESMEDITITATSLFFSVLSAQSNYQQSIKNYEDRQELYEIAKKRFELGTITKSDILQMELSLLNEQVAVNDNKIDLNDRLYSLFSYLRITDYEGVELIPPYTIPEIFMNTQDVMQKALDNTSYLHSQQLSVLESEKNLARVKATKGLQVRLNSEIGFTQTGNDFKSAYSRLKDNEIIGVSVSMPIFDWGVSKGRVKMAEAQVEITKTRIEQEQLEFNQTINRKVMQFNSHSVQCKNALRAQDISAERYEISKKRFSSGAISVTDLNTAQSEMENAKSQYLNHLRTFWTDYYDLEKITLYDWILKRDINVDFDKIK